MRAPYRDDHDALMSRLVALLDDLEGLRGRGRELHDVERDTRRVEGEIAGLRKEIARVAPTRLPLLDRISIAAPCSADWNAMSGDERARFCGQCQKHVYNIASMTAEDAETFLREAAGEACVRLYRRADGTVLTSDCAVGVRRRKRRRAVASLVGGGLVAAGALVATARSQAPAAINPTATASLAETAAPTAVAEPPRVEDSHYIAGGAPPIAPREHRIEAEMAHVRTVLERRAKMTNPADLKAAEAEIRAARERIAVISKSPY